MVECYQSTGRGSPLLCRLLFAILFFGMGPALATAPTLYRQPAHQSPVRADPGDLLMLAGYGLEATDTVVYQAIRDTTQPLSSPYMMPGTSTATSGVAPVVSVLNIPHALTIKLPTVMQADGSYALWVRNARGEWSNGVRINDARPFWLTPDYAYVTERVANLPRYLKVVGRNLQPAPGSVTQVRLIGPGTFTMIAENDGDPATAIERYVAKVPLPATLPAGSYTVQLSRDGVGWVTLNGQTLSVLADPESVGTFPVEAYGGCAPNDGADDTLCIANSISAAKQNGGGTVTVGPGVWDMNYSGAIQTKTPVTFDGVLVPVGVSLVGAGPGLTTIRRGTSWPAAQPNFALQGNNTVQGITFQDLNVYTPSSAATSILRLGVHWWFARLYDPSDPTYVSGVVITQNVFDKPYRAITDGGLPIDHLFITHNEFGAYFDGFSAGGDGNNIDQKFHIDDSVVAFNTFEPGSYSDPSISQGVIASGLSAGHRVDFSDNTADGASPRYLYNPATDAHGWRAAFFWAMRGNHENVLVSRNTATCTGDKAGDGEAIAYDGNGQKAALPSAQPVLAATPTTLMVPGPLLSQQDGHSVPANYYVEHWLSIAQGPGRGQTRKIVAYSDPTASTVTFTVTPAWEVVPRSTSLATVARQFWQVYTVDNVVDQRQPLCQKQNANLPSGGVIGLWGQSVDSAVEGNRQYDTSGILLGLGYHVRDAQYATEPTTSYQWFVDVRGNIVDHEYAWASDCSWAGIQLYDGASPTPGFPPPPEGYGVSISHNTITQADGLGGGAIALTRGWYAGPPPGTWNLADNTLVFRNTINDVTGPPSSTVSPFLSCTHSPAARVGLRMSDGTVWHTVLADNSCNNVAKRLTDGGTASQRVCGAQSASNSCECSAYVQGNSYVRQDPQRVISVPYPGGQAAGNLNLVAVGWGDSTARVRSVVDSRGNVYALASAPILNAGTVAQSIYYAKNIAAALSNQVTVTFDAPAAAPDIRIAEYSGLDPANPIDVAVSAAGNSGVSDSGFVTTSNASDLLVAANYGAGGETGAGPNYTQRLPINGNGAILQDRIVSTSRAYNATAPVSPGSHWVMQLVALRLAGSGGNTQALTAPTELAARVVSNTRVDLSWTVSTDNIGVTGYLVERCRGMSCTDFEQIAAITDTIYCDTGVAAATSYRYRVRATDVANLNSSYSGVVSAATP